MFHLDDICETTALETEALRCKYEMSQMRKGEHE